MRERKRERETERERKNAVAYRRRLPVVLAPVEMARQHGRTSTIHDGVQRIGWHVSFTIYNAHKYRKNKQTTSALFLLGWHSANWRNIHYYIVDSLFSFYDSPFKKKIWLELDMWEMRAASPSCRVTKVNSNIDSWKSNVGHQTEGVTLCILYC